MGVCEQMSSASLTQFTSQLEQENSFLAQANTAAQQAVALIHQDAGS